MDLISKKEAKEKGLSFYFTGKTCRNGGLAPRRVSNNQCTCDECKKIKNAWHKKYLTSEKARESKNATSRRYYKRNKDLHAQRVKDWKKRNKEKWSDYCKQYYEENYRRHYEENKHKYIRRARERQRNLKHATVAWIDEDKVKEFYDLASLLRDATGVDWDVDHMIPLKGDKVCGLHSHQNLQVMPSYFNTVKHNKLMYTEYLSWIEDYEEPLFTPIASKIARDGRETVNLG